MKEKLVKIEQVLRQAISLGGSNAITSGLMYLHIDFNIIPTKKQFLQVLNNLVDDQTITKNKATKEFNVYCSVINFKQSEEGKMLLERIKPKKDKNTFTIGVRLSLELYNKVMRISYDERLSASTVIRNMIESY
jgi:hypothetical protein